MTSEERGLLRKAAADPKGQIAIKRAQQTWHLDRERWTCWPGAGTCVLWVKEWVRILGERSPSGRSRLPDEPSPSRVVRTVLTPVASRERGRRPVSWLRPTSLRLAAERRAS